MSETIECCGHCKYFVFMSDDWGECHRFPTVVDKDAEDWCGEFVFHEALVPPHEKED